MGFCFIKNNDFSPYIHENAFRAEAQAAADVGTAIEVEAMLVDDEQVEGIFVQLVSGQFLGLCTQ